MKRLRPVNSCLPCRNRRLKCDKQHPTCGRCASQNQTCVYDSSSVAVTHDQDMTDRPLPTPTTRSHNQGDQLSSNNASSTRIERERGRFSFSQGGRASYDGATFWGNAIPSDVIESDDLHDNSRPPGLNALLDPISVGTLAVEVGPFHLPPNGRFSISSSAANQCRLCGKGYRLQCVQAMLPGKETCVKLCSIFFGKIFPLIPILHLPSFRLDFDELMNPLGSGNECQRGVAPVLRRRPGLLCVVFSMMFSAQFCSSPSELKAIIGTDLSDCAIENHYLAIMLAAHLTGFPRRPSLYTLAAYVFTQSHFAREEAFRDAPEFVSMSFRIAIGMGLHRNLPNSSLSASDVETRRRLWWYIQHLDVMASCSSGLSPLFIDEKMANASAIADYDEHTIGAGQNFKQRDVRYVVADTRYKVSSEIRNILRQHFENAFDSPGNLAAAVHRLEALSVRVNKVCNNLLSMTVGQASAGAPIFDLNFCRTWTFEPIPPNDHQVAGFTSWSVILLHMMIHKAYCTLYHPLFSQSQPTDASQNIEPTAVEHAQAFLYLFIRLCDDPSSSSFHWMYPGTYQPLQPLALLVADLLQRPWSDHFVTSRGIIDEVFERYSVDHGIVNQVDPIRRDLPAAHKGAWTVLARGRRKALELSGEDPHILLPAMDTDLEHCLCGQQIAIDQSRSSAFSSNLSEHSASTNGIVAADVGLSAPSSSIVTNGVSVDHLQTAAIGIDADFTGTEAFDWNESHTMLGAGSGFMM